MCSSNVGLMVISINELDGVMALKALVTPKKADVIEFHRLHLFVY